MHKWWPAVRYGLRLPIQDVSAVSDAYVCYACIRASAKALQDLYLRLFSVSWLFRPWILCGLSGGLYTLAMTDMCRARCPRCLNVWQCVDVALPCASMRKLWQFCCGVQREWFRQKQSPKTGPGIRDRKWLHETKPQQLGDKKMRSLCAIECGLVFGLMYCPPNPSVTRWS